MQVASTRPLAPLALLAIALSFSGCNPDSNGKKGPSDAPSTPVGEEPSATPPEPSLRRLTADQYRHAIEDLFGAGLALPTQLDPDVEREGLLAIGAAEVTLSPLGVEQYEGAATLIAEQVIAAGAHRDAWLSCAPTGASDDPCAADALAAIGRRAWRRSLTDTELDFLTDVYADATEQLDDPYEGIGMALTAVLQSPYFVYRVELGENGRYTPTETASRLSFFLWNTTPDEALLAAAEQGELSTPEGMAAQVDRLLGDPRARDGLDAFVADMLTLAELDHLSKDPTVFPAMRSELGPSAREETLLTTADLVFDEDGDFRTWLTRRDTWVDRNLAMLYAIPAPSRDGFEEVTLPEDGIRAGLLGQASVLLQHAHPVSTSATLRGKFIREVLLCQSIPPPPADVDTSIPEPSEDAATLRERVAVHLEEPSCAGCHQLTDPVGLALENFDGLAIERLTENGAIIDPSGDLDGEAFANAVELGEVLSQEESFTMCIADTLYAMAAGHRPDAGEALAVDWLHARFEEDGYSLASMMRQIATSELFITAGEVTP